MILLHEFGGSRLDTGPYPISTCSVTRISVNGKGTKILSSMSMTICRRKAFMSIKALIFDMHGVLLFSHEASIEESFAKRLKIPVEQVGRVFHDEFDDKADSGEITQREFWLHAWITWGFLKAGFLISNISLRKDSSLTRSC